MDVRLPFPFRHSSGNGNKGFFRGRRDSCGILQGALLLRRKLAGRLIGFLAEFFRILSYEFLFFSLFFGGGGDLIGCFGFHYITSLHSFQIKDSLRVLMIANDIYLAILPAGQPR